MEGFTLQGPRAGDWRLAAALVSVAGFAMALAAMYGSPMAMLWPLPLLGAAAASVFRWYHSPRVRLVVTDGGLIYSLQRGDAPIPWSTMESFRKESLGGRDCVLVRLVDGDELPIDPSALGLKADELMRMLDGCRRAMAER